MLVLYNGNIMGVQRQLKLLDFIIREFVKTARPVGSESIARHGTFAVSPATIRNDMSDLEQGGYLAQLHTSGGRVPTDKAYRWFVNSLLANDDLEPAREDKRKIRTALAGADLDPEALNRTVANVIQQLSDQLVIAGSLGSSHFYKVGLTSLLEFPEFREVNRIFNLTSFFEEFENIFEVFEKEFFSDINSPLNVMIGKENPMRQVRGETVILAKYNLPDDTPGSLTLIGPTRMDYEKNLALIKYTINEINNL